MTQLSELCLDVGYSSLQASFGKVFDSNVDAAAAAICGSSTNTEESLVGALQELETRSFQLLSEKAFFDAHQHLDLLWRKIAPNNSAKRFLTHMYPMGCMIGSVFEFTTLKGKYEQELLEACIKRRNFFPIVGIHYSSQERNISDNR